MATAYAAFYDPIYDTVWDDPEGTLYTQFYDPWVMYYDEPSHDRMSLDTTAPGALEIRHFIDLYSYPACKRGIVQPKPYRFHLPPSVAERIISNWEKAKADEVEVVFEDLDPTAQPPLLEPVGLSHFPEIPEEDYAYYLRHDSDDEDGVEGVDVLVDDGEDAGLAGDVAEDVNANVVEDGGQDMATDVDEDDAEAEELAKGWKKIEIGLVDCAERITGKFELRMWRVKNKCATLGKKFRKTVKKKWEDLGSV